MEYRNLPGTNDSVSRIALGCMRIADLNEEQLYQLIQTALEQGINFFDHADIYGNGQSEILFGKVLAAHPELRGKMVIQSKCDIVTPVQGGPRYDTDRDYIVAQVRQSIKRLQCGYLDVLLLHRPDPLMDPEEVASAFRQLKEEGLVKAFGVSNFPPSKIELLEKAWKEPLSVNQIQLSIVHAPSIDEDVFFNMKEERAQNKAGHVLDAAMLKGTMLQAWCPLQASWEEGTFLNHPKYPELNAELDKLAKKYKADKAAIAAAWILRLPAEIQVIAGTTNPEHLKAFCKASEIRLGRQEWYDLYLAGGRQLP